MKRFLAMILCVATLVSSLVFTSVAVTEPNTAVRIADTNGATGYSDAAGILNERIKNEGGATVIMDVMVESVVSPDEGMFSQIAAFTGGGTSGKPFNLLSYDFSSKQFRAGTDSTWLTYPADDYKEVATNSFEWEIGRWYELAFRFNGKKAAIYLNGICVISTEFDTASIEYLIVYPQFCTAVFDNVRLCDKSYSVADNIGEVWGTEDFSNLFSVESSDVWYCNSAYSFSDNGACFSHVGDVNDDGMVTSIDLATLSRYLTGGHVSIATGSDVDMDGDITATDAAMLSRIVLGADIEAESIDVAPVIPDNSAVVDVPEDVDMGSGSGDTSGLDASALKFTASGTTSYSLLFSDQPQLYTDMALTFDVFVESVDTDTHFAGLGVWSGNGTEGRSSFVGYDFIDKRFTNDDSTFYPDVPVNDSNVTMNLSIGEWNHFCFRRLNNNTFRVYVNGTLCYEVSGFDYANTYYIFGFKNCTAYVDNYQYYHAGTGCGLVTDFTAGASTDSSGNTRFSDGGYWVVGSQGYAGVVKGKPGFDGSVLKFNGNTASSYTLVLNEGPISNTDIALSFDVFVESIDNTMEFAGLGVWNGDGTFIGYDFKDRRFTAKTGQGYPNPPDTDNGDSLELNVGEWNHFVFRRINNTAYVVYVNGVKSAEITGLSFSNTYMIFGFKHCVGYIDNYQAYENGVGKGLYTDFSKFTRRSDGALISPDGGYFIIGTQGFDSIYTAKSGSVTGTGIAGTSAVPGSSAIDGTHRIDLKPGSGTAPVLGENVDYSTKCTTGWELANRAVNIAKYYKTLYIMGCFGAPMTAKNKTRYTQNHSYNTDPTRTAMINAASSDTFGFDCVCLIKGILWGWSGKLNTSYGGASYKSNGVPDFGSNTLEGVYVGNTRSKDWSNIEIGEAVWMKGHIGIYIGNGLAVECTPAWDNKVQITAVGNIGTVKGYNTRTWTAHGKLVFVEY